MFKKLYRAIVLFFYGLFNGARSADKLLNAQTNEDEANVPDGIEQQQEQKSVLNDLIKGEVTEEVRQLRHEMYYAERKSYEYTYTGGGRVRKNDLFKYKGKYENSDGLDVIIVQENDTIPDSLTECGIKTYVDNTQEVTDNVENVLRNRTRSEIKHRIKFDRKYLPRFRIENYLNKLIVKSVDENTVMIDLYVTKYINKFEPTSRLFHAEMEKIYQGFVNDTDVINFDRIHFTSYKAYGLNDLIEVSYTDLKFLNIVEFDGNYVLKYYAKPELHNDLIDEFYDEKTAKKCENHEMREGAILNFMNEYNKNHIEQIDVSEATELINKIKNH